jgi:hypothetical protein
VEFTTPLAKEDIAFYSKVIEAECVPVASDPTGELLSDRLVISGPIIQATLRYELEVVDGGDSLRVTLQIGNEEPKDWKPDYPLHKQGRAFIEFGETVFCLGVRYAAMCNKVLALRCVNPSQNFYERIGITSQWLWLEAESWFKGVDMKNPIKIV